MKNPTPKEHAVKAINDVTEYWESEPIVDETSQQILTQLKLKNASKCCIVL